METHTELQNYDRFSDDIIFTLFGLCHQCVYSIIDERYRNCRANVHTLRFIFYQQHSIKQSHFTHFTKIDLSQRSCKGFYL